MPEEPTELAPPKAEPQTEPESSPMSSNELVEEDLLVEDVSIDGMCGVY